MDSPRILITGNLGYVGPGVVRQLRQAFPDAELIGYDLGLFAHCLTGPAPLPEVCLDRQVFGDVRHLPSGLLTGVNVVVHLAAISNDPMGTAYEDVTMAVNHEASVHLARVAKAHGARAFVFASSCSVYGLGGDEWKSEDAALNPLTAYARSKVATERDLTALADDKFRVTCLRFATACGWSERLRLDLVLNDFVASAVATGEITILSDGTPWRPLIHVRDMARAVLWATHRPLGGPFLALNVGSNAWNYRVRELAEAVARNRPDTKVRLSPTGAPDRRSYRVDFDLFRQLAPEHQPLMSLDATIAELTGKLLEMWFIDPDFRTSRLMRLRVLKVLVEQGDLTPDLTWAPMPRPAPATLRPAAPVPA
ncbi:SDR family oxidoreductase [Hymenobacter sp. BT523]|uniref:NAD-dependent epimerase/dehydratase family protein n=1 Tax=Hymenobacter sp. BT523 TaxID=2795725 RepID=UPI0018EC90D1|nr:SDR family oxidoreductase [Hymenobacter sp. BT523]MBJ6110369.1 SDR family oxidoreductase [Hymenobacter sp. BT523]